MKPQWHAAAISYEGALMKPFRRNGNTEIGGGGISDRLAQCKYGRSVMADKYGGIGYSLA
jgi:hypothetical protein